MELIILKISELHFYYEKQLNVLAIHTLNSPRALFLKKVKSFMYDFDRGNFDGFDA